MSVRSSPTLNRPTGPAPSRLPAPAGSGELTVSKVLAGAGAAATSALIGSLFGAEGTVVGATLGSVVSTVAGVLYQRSLERARDRVRARVLLAGGRTVDVPDPARRPRPRGARLTALVLVTAVAFVLGMLAVTGVELLHGSTLGGDGPGTSIGRITEGGDGSTHVDDAGTREDAGDAEVRRPDPDATPSAVEPTPTSAPPTSEAPDEPEPTADPSEPAWPTAVPGLGDLVPSGEGRTGDPSPTPTAADED